MNRSCPPLACAGVARGNDVGRGSLRHQRPRPGQDLERGAVRHLLPGVSHNRLLLKASFVRALTAPLTLRAGSRKATGVRLDTSGELYAFDLTALEASQTYQLLLEDAGGKPPCATRGRLRRFRVRTRSRKLPAVRVHLRRRPPGHLESRYESPVLGIDRPSAKNAVDGTVATSPTP